MINDLLRLAARILLAILFAVTGYWKLADPSTTAELLGSMGLPAPEPLTYAMAACEIFAAAAVISGFGVRAIGFLLAIWCLATGVLIHFTSPLDLMRNLGLAGGFLLLATGGAGSLAIDRALRPDAD